MHGELAEIVEFIESVRPFDELSQELLHPLCKELTIRYFKRDQKVLKVDEQTDSLYIVRTGAVDIHDAQGEFITRSNERDCFGFISALNQQPSSSQAVAHEDSLVYVLAGESFRYACDQDKDFKDYFVMAESERLRKALNKRDDKQFHFSARLAAPVKNMIKRDPVLSIADVSILEAVQKMATENVSTLMIVDQQGELSGLITDRDIRKRVVAQNMDVNKPVSTVMSEKLTTIDSMTMAFEAGLLMMRHNIHHLPVVSHNKPIGLISTTDLLKLSNQSPVYTISEISKANSVDELKTSSQAIPEILSQLVDNGLPAYQVGQVVSTLGENINIRLLQLAEDKFGPAPIEYCWLAAGSLGRREQLLHSDQDNALLLSDDYDAAIHDEYFLPFAQYISDGLDECGYIYCPGDVMATNPKWRQSLSGWQKYFNKWINKPKPKALMYCSIFFDMRCLYGCEELFDQLKAYYLGLAQNNNMFLGHMSVNALKNTPPLGFFRQFVLVSSKKHKRRLNLKKRGTVPIVDLARVYSLAGGLDGINTHNRILQAKAHKVISKDAADNLLDAYEFINHFRMEHQANQLNQKMEPDNHAHPSELSAFERDHLRDAFKIVAEMQKYLAQRYTGGHMR